MDPTKSFDHLDPKLKETYARVMGTDTNSSNTATANPAMQQTQMPSISPTPDNTLTSAPPAGDSTQNHVGLSSISTTPQPNLDATPLSTTPSMNMSQTTPSSQFSQPLETPPPTATPDANSPVTSSSPFFSNPSPASSEPQQSSYAGNGMEAPAVEPPVSPTPVTPYTPADLGANLNASAEQFAQPLPSPSSVSQTAPHETSALLKVLYIVGSVIFFAIYTIFWIKVFNLPFLF